MKWLWIFLSVSVLIVIVFQVGVWLSMNKVERLSYEVKLKTKGVEVREYPERLKASFEIPENQDYEDFSRRAFGGLFQYISGGNENNEKISMTSPVEMEWGENSSRMSFFMPSEKSLDNMSNPDNQYIHLKVDEPVQVAALKFGGYATSKRIEKKVKKLRNKLANLGYAYEPGYKLLGYNPPFQWVGRRNEIIIELR